MTDTDTQVYWTKHPAGLTLLVGEATAVVDRTNPNYDLIEAALKVKDYKRVLALANVKQTVAKALESSGHAHQLRIRDGQIYWTGQQGEELVRGPLVDRIIATVRHGSTAQSIQPLVRLLTNISRNKRKDMREELYQFLMSGKMPITVDGCFLAYKRVRHDFKDCHSGTFDNSPGKLVAMPEGKVDTNRHNLCSVGLHFCSRGYLSEFHSGGKTVIVKVNPRNVFAIPTDYAYAKGRASEYYVVGEVTGNPEKDEMFLAPFVFDENLTAAAPEVKFLAKHDGVGAPASATTSSLKPSLKTMAEGYGLSVGGRCWVRVRDTKGDLGTDKYTVVKPDSLPVTAATTFVSSITGKPVPAEHVTDLSIQTKSVRSILARAVARRRNRG